MLADGNFHSGQDLGKRLGITRSAIWKSIHELSKLGIHIVSVVGKGYQIPGGLSLLDQKALTKELNDGAQQMLDQIIVLDQVDSTNTFLMNQIQSQPNRTLACLAEQQTQGKGRRGRHWVSPFGHNIYLSLLFHFNKDPSELMGLSIAIAIAVSKTLQKLGVNDGLGLKWPNDILYNGKKLCGILLEMVAKQHEQTSIVMGVGINTQVNDQEAINIDQPWISLSDILDAPIDRNLLASMLINELILTAKKFAESGLEPFIKDWERLDCYRGKAIVLHTPKEQINGIMQGISNRGELQLLKADQTQVSFMSGEVSVRLEDLV